MRSKLLTLVTLAALAALVVTAPAQDGATPFRAAQVVGGGFDRFDLTCDLNLDGHVDYIGGWQDQVQWYENHGNGLVNSTHLLLTSTSAQFASFASTDLDNDGNLDVVCFSGTTALAILARPGGPLVHTSVIAEQGPTILLADLQGDGEPEFVGSSLNIIRALAYDTSSHTFQTVLSAGAATGKHFVADIDGDGKDEIWRYANVGFWIWSVDAAWNVTQTAFLANALSDEIMPVVGDVDGDGDSDLVLFEDGLNTDRFVLFRRDASGLLVEEAPAIGGPATHLGDVDGDGDLDGLCCGGGTGPYPNNKRSDYMISFNDGNGQFSPARAVRGLGAVRLAGCVDVDGDGDKDLVGGRCIIFNPGNIKAAFAMPGGYAARYESLHDADRDLDADLGLTGNASRFEWMEARGDGSFVRNFAGIGSPSPSMQSTGLVGDFDGDGDVDGLLETASGVPPQLRLYRNIGGVFGIPIDAAPAGLSMQPTSQGYSGNGTSWTNHWRFAHDWDADGDLDCIVVDESHSWTKLFENGGTGYFTAGPVLPSGFVVTGVGDFTGDGAPDLLAGATGNLNLLYYLPATSAGFGPPVLISNATRRDQRPGIVDIDEDGDLDILSSSPSGGVLLRNHGGGVFAAEPQAFASIKLAHWSFADVDENGKLDAVSHQPYFDDHVTSSIILQNTDGTFAPPVVLVAAVSAIADADHDGDLDLLGDETIKNRIATGTFGTLGQYGNGTPGTYQVRPRINDIGITAPGNPMLMYVSGMRGAAPGLWVLGIGHAAIANNPLPGFTLYVDQILSITPFVANGTSGDPGGGSWTVPWRMLTGFGGIQLSSQAFCLDPAGAQGWTQTNGKVMTLPF